MALYAPTASVHLFSDAGHLTVSMDVVQTTAMSMVLPFVYAVGAMGAVATFCNRFVIRPPRFVLLSLCFAVFAASSIGICAVGIQVDSFNEMRAATAVFSKTVTSATGTVGALEAAEDLCVNADWKAKLVDLLVPEFSKKLDDLETQFSAYSVDALSYSDTILTTVLRAQLSMAPLYASMFLIAVTVLLFSLLHSHNTRTTFVPIWVVLPVMTVLGLACGVVLTVLRLQSNLCMQPADSIIDAFDVTSAELSYYLQCTLNPALPSPFAAVFANITKVADGIVGMVDVLDPSCPTAEIGVLGRRFIADASCESMTLGPRRLVVAVCRESFNAMVLLFGALAAQLALLSWLACTMRV